MLFDRLFRIYYYFNLFFFLVMLSFVVIVVTGTFILFFFCFLYINFLSLQFKLSLGTRNSCRYCSSKNKRLKQRTYFVENCSVFFAIWRNAVVMRHLLNCMKCETNCNAEKKLINYMSVVGTSHNCSHSVLQNIIWYFYKM